MDAPLSARSLEGHVSVARVTRAWYVCCTSDELGAMPLARTLLGRPLVLFRAGERKAAALLDRCPHRNVPLSLGHCVGGVIECAYHGWQFDGEGRCTKVPSLVSEPGWKRPVATRFPVREQDGYVWVWADEEVEPDVEPYKLPGLDQPGYSTVRRVVEAEATLHATLENALDVPHTAFLHKGLFRGGGEKHVIKAVTTRTRDSVVTEYIGEPRPEGLVGRILSPSGGVVTHHDRFILPSIAQVEYAIGSENHIVATSIATPVEDFKTRMYAVVSFKMRLPAFMVKPFLEPIAMRIFGQDARILKVQSDAIRRFGGESYTSTEIDLMGPQIWRLLRRAESGKLDDEDDAWQRETELEVG